MRVGLIGAGNMARALARGWGDPVLCSDHGSGRAQALVDELGGEALASNLEVAERADLVVLCHKPAQLKLVAGEIAATAKAVVSVLGATTHTMVRSAYAGIPVFRAMPNTAVEVRRGVICLAEPESHVHPAPSVPDAFVALERELIALFERIATVIKLPERLIDPATAVMGVGPAYQALLAEAQVDAAVRRGLSPVLAGRLVTATMTGTAALLEHRDLDTLRVRREVTSPGGSTARGLAALEAAGVRGAFHEAIDAVLDGGARR
ncbi:MAG TPA: pyrroline-5-carboxylate reductase dimerization domain-containing protein [Solirubrobacteraceae bacterium]|nr:pyrroline-5-carboxylate reductase dimerization domain-containing protein [Solirubrobacteraceae bacterium]